MLCCAVHGEAGSIISCLANKRHNNGGFAACHHAPTPDMGRWGKRLWWACIKMNDKMPHRVANMFSLHTVHKQHLFRGLRMAKGHSVTHTHTHKHTQSLEVSHRRVWAYGKQRAAVKPGEELSLQIAIVETAGKEHTSTPACNERLSTQSVNNLNKHTQCYTLESSRLLWIKHNHCIGALCGFPRILKLPNWCSQIPLICLLQNWV